MPLRRIPRSLTRSQGFNIIIRTTPSSLDVESQISLSVLSTSCKYSTSLHSLCLASIHTYISTTSTTSCPSSQSPSFKESRATPSRRHEFIPLFSFTSSSLSSFHSHQPINHPPQTSKLPSSIFPSTPMLLSPRYVSHLPSLPLPPPQLPSPTPIPTPTIIAHIQLTPTVHNNPNHPPRLTLSPHPRPCPSPLARHPKQQWDNPNTGCESGGCGGVVVYWVGVLLQVCIIPILFHLSHRRKINRKKGKDQNTNNTFGDEDLVITNPIKLSKVCIYPSKGSWKMRKEKLILENSIRRRFNANYIPPHLLLLLITLLHRILGYNTRFRRYQT